MTFSVNTIKAPEQYSGKNVSNQKYKYKVRNSNEHKS